MVSLSVLLAIVALVIAVMAGVGRAPLWVAVLLLALIHLLALPRVLVP